MIDQMKEKYSVGALLYSPALNGKIAEAVISEKFGKSYSLALCLEDTIADNSVGLAEEQLEQTLKEIHMAHKSKSFYPLLYSTNQRLKSTKILSLYFLLLFF